MRNQSTSNLLLFAGACTIALLALLHLVALKYTLYWVYPWFDILTHFIGGVWVGLIGIWLSMLAIKKDTLSTLFLYGSALGAVALIGVSWEVFEFYIGVPKEANFVSDTTIDLTMDVVGALLAVQFALFLIRHKIKHSHEVYEKI